MTLGRHTLSDQDRVVGLIVNGAALPVPLNILPYHETVKLNRDGTQIELSYCPLTGSHSPSIARWQEELSSVSAAYSHATTSSSSIAVKTLDSSRK